MAGAAAVSDVTFWRVNVHLFYALRNCRCCSTLRRLVASSFVVATWWLVRGAELCYNNSTTALHRKFETKIGTGATSPHPLRLLYIPSTYCVIVELELFTIKSVLFAVVNFVSNGCFYCDYLFMTFLYKECERFNYHFAPHRRNKGLTFRFFASSLVGQFWPVLLIAFRWWAITFFNGPLNWPLWMNFAVEIEEYLCHSQIRSYIFQFYFVDTFQIFLESQHLFQRLSKVIHSTKVLTYNI